MKNKSLIILLGILIILSSIAIAYKEEITEIAERSEMNIESYIAEKMQYLPEDKQIEFENFKSLKIEDKLLKSWELNSNSEEGPK